MARYCNLLILPLLLALSSCNTGTPTNCTFTVTLAQHPGVMFHGAGVPAAGGDYSVDVVANPSTCQAPTQTPDSWITIAQEPPDRGLGYRITAAPNTGAGRRTGTAYVGYQALTVDQAGSGGSGCTFQLVPGNASFTAAGGTGAFVIVPNDVRCGWSVERSANGEDWSTEPSPNRGVGPTGIVFQVKSSASAPQPPLPRQAQMQVKDSANAAAGSHTYGQQ